MSAYTKTPTQILSLPKGPGETIAIPPEHGTAPASAPDPLHGQQPQHPAAASPDPTAAGATYYAQLGAQVGPPRIFYELESIFVATRHMETALRKEQGRVASLQREIQAERSRYQQAVQEASQRIRHLTTDLEKVKTELQSEKANGEKLAGQVKTLSTALITVRNELDATRRGLAAHKRKIVEDHESFRHQIALEQKKSAALAEQLQTQKQEAENAIQEHKKRIQQLADHEGKLKAELDSQISRRKDIQETLDQTLAELNSEKIAASKVAFQGQKTANELADTKTRLQQAEEELNKFRNAWREMVTHEKKQREQAAEKLARSQNSVKELEDRSRHMADEMTEYKMNNGMLQQEVTRLTGALETSRTAVEQGRKELDQARREASVARNELLETRNALQARVQEAEAQAKDLGNKLVELQLHVRDLQEGSTGASERLEHTESENAALREQISGFEHALNAMQAELSKSVLERDRDRARHEADLEAARAENERLRNIYPLRDLLATKEREIGRVQQEMSSIPEDHPDRASVDEVLEVMMEQRDQIQAMLAEAERKAEV